MLQGFRSWFLEQLAMYAAYHRDPRNQRTHHVGVPLIVFSLLLALSQAPIVPSDVFPVTAATVILGLLLLSYVVAFPVTGLFTTFFYGAVYGLVMRIAEGSSSTIWTVAGVAFFVGWAIQFVGHAFEGRRPALTVNLMQAFMAPPFLVAEVLFGLGLEKEVEAAVRERSKKFAAKKPA